ncbi:hypothetical protein CR155_06940 [Pollutimonas nitritireducens]|uniref:Uncharacterized protein n=2 Tax=Pollutimonas nitritireducens TaxID=2045209 RepID=A0A2N4UHK9_9BURK|nr:hypothetical protein CR155_06940 [Pollutimonas nitritireducens]
MNRRTPPESPEAGLWLSLILALEQRSFLQVGVQYPCSTGLPATGLPATGLPATGLPATGLPAYIQGIEHEET